MSDYYTKITADSWLPCLKEDADRLSDLLDESSCGLTITWYEHNESGKPGMTVDAAEGFSEEEVPAEFLLELGRIITNAGLPYWQWGVAFGCTRPLVGSCGGNDVRVCHDGRLVWAKKVWPEHKQSLTKCVS